MEIRVEHVALWVRDLEGARDFFTRHLGARAGEKYQNPRTGFSSYFLTFDSGARLEVMTRPDLSDPASLPSGAAIPGSWAHLAFSLGSAQAVDETTRALQEAGCRLVSGPRRTGDGYYESCLEGFEGCLIELTV